MTHSRDGRRCQNSAPVLHLAHVIKIHKPVGKRRKVLVGIRIEMNGSIKDDRDKIEDTHSPPVAYVINIENVLCRRKKHLLLLKTFLPHILR